MPTKNLSDEQLLAIIQGLLFIAGNEGLSLETIVGYLGLKHQKNKIANLLIQLQTKLAAEQTSGLTIIKLGQLYKLTTKSSYHEFYQGLQKQSFIRLSQAALETLAIIAYNQPITKAKVEEIRGVSCEAIINKLKGLNFIKEAARSELPGRPFFYTITDEFMDHFQLESLAQLPDLPNFNDEPEKEIYNYSDVKK